MFPLKYKNTHYALDKYVYMSSSMMGDRIIGVFDTEEDLAYYAFGKGHYGLGTLTTVCTYHDLYTPNGHKFSQKEYDALIEKYFPKETSDIKNRRELGQKAILHHLVNWGILDFWIVKQQKMLENLPLDIKEKIQAVNAKSDAYIISIFNEEPHDPSHPTSRIISKGTTRTLPHKI